MAWSTDPDSFAAATIDSVKSGVHGKAVDHTCIPVAFVGAPATAQRLPPVPAEPTEGQPPDQASAPSPSGSSTGFSNIYDYLNSDPQFSDILQLIEAAPSSADLLSEYLTPKLAHSACDDIGTCDDYRHCICDMCKALQLGRGIDLLPGALI